MKLNRILNILPLMVFAAADDCQPYTWGRKRSEGDNFPPPGTIVCRLNGTSPAEVNYYTCKEMAVKYKIKVEEFFTLNPQVDQDCKTIKPMTPYCVKGCKSTKHLRIKDTKSLKHSSYCSVDFEGWFLWASA